MNANCAAFYQGVVTVRPSSSPAGPSANVPEQIESNRLAQAPHCCSHADEDGKLLGKFSMISTAS